MADSAVDVGWVALSLLRHVGLKTIRALLANFDTVDAVLSADQRDLKRVPGVGPKIAGAITEIDLRHTENAISRWHKAGVTVLTLHDPAYPTRLRDLDDAPPTLFLRGEGVLPPATTRVIGIVGTRHPTPNSARTAFRLASGFTSSGYVVVSGLALGVDTEAHRGALHYPDGITFAVLGGGVLNPYPPENWLLTQTILKRGLLLSEQNPDAGVNSAGLVSRNRIISGLSDGLLVIETAVDGGAMHAARFAKLQGRKLFAVNNDATGNRALIDGGAFGVTAIED